jgi:uncharacterized phosphosugar-binding protein
LYVAALHAGHCTSHTLHVAWLQAVVAHVRCSHVLCREPHARAVGLALTRPRFRADVMHLENKEAKKQTKKKNKKTNKQASKQPSA